MISPFLPAHEVTTVALDFGVFIAEQARTHRVSQTAIIAALRPCITPSQPEAPSKPHAPAADTPATQAAGDTTDGEEEQASSLPPFLSVDPIPEPAAPAINPVRPTDPQAKQAVEGALSSEPGGVQDRSESTPPPPSKRMTKREQVRACHIEHPDWTSHQIAEHLGFGVQHIQVMASHLSLKLPRAPRAAAENMRDKVLAVIAAHPEWALRKVATEAGCSLGTAAKWAKEAAGKPQEAEQKPDEPQAETAPELPPVSLPSERLPPPPVVRRARAAPTGRFYLRDKTTGHFVHQSLQPNAAGDGPMMTFDRKWAWYDTMERYRGAKKRWPQIEAMRKEASGK